MTISRIFCAVFLTILVGFAQPAKAQEVPLNVAVVDFEKIFAVAAAPQNIRKQMETISRQMGTEFNKQENTLRSDKDSLIQKQSLLTPEAFQEERRKFDQKVIKAQKEAQQKKQALQKAHIQAQDQVKKKLSEIILQISQQKNLTLVLKRSQTVVVADILDITDQIIEQLNAQLPNVKVNVGS